MSAMEAPIGVAVVGAGLWAKMVHLPAILASENLSLKAIYSRSLASASAAASTLKAKDDGPQATVPTPQLYSQDAGPGCSYADLLAREDIQAVVVCLGIEFNPSHIEAALRAGKRVLAEKPIAPDVQRGLELIKLGKEFGEGRYVVGENYRLLPSLAYARENVAALGALKGFTVDVFLVTKPDSIFLVDSPWRRKPSHQGGFLFDAGTHFVAILRALLAASSDRLASLSATTAQVSEHLPPLDTAFATMRTANGAIGSFRLSVGFPILKIEVVLMLEGGIVTFTLQGVTVERSKPEPGSDACVEKEFTLTEGADLVVPAWAAALGSGSPDPLQTPEQALADVEVLEAIIRSSERDSASLALLYQ